MLRRERGRAEDDSDEDESYMYDDEAYDDFFDRQLERPDGEPGGDGYYVRTSDGRLIGPLYEHRFKRLRSGRQKHRIRSAYRLSAGHVFPITLRTRFVWSNVCSCAACGHALELCIVFIAFASTASCCYGPAAHPTPAPRSRARPHASRHIHASPQALIVWVVYYTEKGRRERERSGMGTRLLLIALCLMTVALTVVTVAKLTQRWRRASTAVFASEV